MSMSVLHSVTPCRRCPVLSKITNCEVTLKFENCQPSGSFKIRGIGHLCQTSVQKGCTGLVCSSGGNAGLAAAHAAKVLSMPITIFVPNTTPSFTVQKLKEEGANVEVIGSVWDEANEEALKLAKQDGMVYVHPFDNPVIWEGHASMIHELNEKPDLVVCSVGGGGLFCGMVRGLKDRGWNDVPVLTVETIGAHSLNAAVEAGKLVTLSGITSIAKSLGAKTVCQAALEATKTHPVVPCTVSDKDVVSSLIKFLDDERILVEPACAASFAVLYNGQLNNLLASHKLLKNVRKILVIVCGGSQVTMEMVDGWKKQLGC